MIVNVPGSDLLGSYVLFSCKFDEALVERVNASSLPANWRDYPITPETQAFGDEWLRSGRSVVLEIPSAVVDIEQNYLLNPAHPDFTKVTISTPMMFVFDPRLLAR